MPPKKEKQGSSSKVKEDKTFGLKNKNKSSKVQAHVAMVKKQEADAAKANKEGRAKEKAKEELAKERAAEQRRKEEINDLFKPVQLAQKVPFGVDPKSVVCSYFRQGTCDKGNKCKFAHNLDVERKSEKKDLYTDARAEDTMDKWSDEKLREVVNSKHGNPKTTTDIVCKHFIDAVESGKYGWFWVCPNGGEDCKYVHALPPGFVLKSQRKKDEEEAAKAEISLEDFLEVERHKLGKDLTPVTKESFAKWKETRVSKKEAQEEATRKAKAATASAGKMNGMSGRDLFTYNPLLQESEDWEEDDGDDDEFDIVAYRAQTEAARAEAERRRMELMGYGDDEPGVGPSEAAAPDGE